MQEKQHCQEQNVITDTKKPFEWVKCPYCDTGQAVKLWFLIGDNRTTADWVDFVTTNPDNRNCLYNVYLCPQCGHFVILDHKKDRQ